MANVQMEVQTKLAKGLLDLIVLQIIDAQPIHGYQVITHVRKTFGVYFGPSTIYPLLACLEKKGQVSSRWSMEGDRPRKVYEITDQGRNLLNFTENSLSLICRTMAKETTATAELKHVEKSRSGIGHQKRAFAGTALTI
jgi:DNA-binding PadR family transcriptional regulator